MTVTIRPASERDEPAITALVRSELPYPLDLDWRRFLVAADARGVAGAVQLRSHSDGSQEVGSLVVRPDARALGIAARLLDALMLFARGRIYMITGARFAAHYAHWGFAPVAATTAPAGVLRNYLLGHMAVIVSRVRGRAPHPLAVLARTQ